MRALLWYGAACAVFLGTAGSVVIALVPAADASSVWLAAAIAWPVQVLAFWVLLLGREASGFMIGWGLGMALRFAAVGVAAVVLTRTTGHDPATALVSLVGFVFVLVLLEPLFLRLAD